MCSSARLPTSCILYYVCYAMLYLRAMRSLRVTNTPASHSNDRDLVSFHSSTSPSRFATSSCFDHESQAGPLNVRRRMRLGHHCRAPPLAVQPSPAPTIRHGGGARRVGAGARRWADLQASVTSTGPVCGQTDPGGRGEIVVGATQSADRSFFDESTSSVW